MGSLKTTVATTGDALRDFLGMQAVRRRGPYVARTAAVVPAYFCVCIVYMILCSLQVFALLCACLLLCLLVLANLFYACLHARLL